MIVNLPISESCGIQCANHCHNIQLIGLGSHCPDSKFGSENQCLLDSTCHSRHSRSCSPSTCILHRSSSTSYPPLVLAAHQGHKIICEELLNKGANVNHSRNDKTTTALHAAICGGHSTIVRLLLENGANPLAQTQLGETAISIARRDNRRHEILEILSSQHKDFELRPIHCIQNYEQISINKNTHAAPQISLSEHLSNRSEMVDCDEKRLSLKRRKTEVDESLKSRRHPTRDSS